MPPKWPSFNNICTYSYGTNKYFNVRACFHTICWHLILFKIKWTHSKWVFFLSIALIYVIHSTLEDLQASSFFHLLCKQTGGTSAHPSKSMYGSFFHNRISFLMETLPKKCRWTVWFYSIKVWIFMEFFDSFISVSSMQYLRSTLSIRWEMWEGLGFSELNCKSIFVFKILFLSTLTISS